MENKVYYKSNLGIFQQHSEHFDDCDADYISYPNFEKAVAEILEREKAIQLQAGVKPACEMERPKLENFLPENTTTDMVNNMFLENIELYNYINALDNYIDELESKSV